MRPGSVGRPVLAAVLSALQPGLGHLYLRAWLRAALWAGLWFGTLGAALVSAGVDLSVGDAVVAVLGVFAAMDGIPLRSLVPLFAVTVFATADAYLLARLDDRRRVAAAGAGRCPRCRKELDPSLDFCHWCTITLDGEESP